MKKLIFILLVAASIISCSNEEETLSSDIESVDTIDMQKYARLFEEYTHFKNDGVPITDKSEVIALFETAEVTLYNPKIKEIQLYSSREKLKEISNVDLDKDKPEMDYEGIFKNPSGLTPDDEGSILIGKDNTSDKSSNLLGVSGLGTIANNSYFTSFAKRVVFTTKYNGTGNIYYTEAKNNSNVSHFSSQAVKINGNGSSVQHTALHMGTSFRNRFLYNNNVITVYNDYNDSNGNESSMFVTLYEGTNYTGGVVILWLLPQEVETVYTYGLSGVKSVKVSDTL